MGHERIAAAEEFLTAHARAARVLDVGCGRGETRRLAIAAGAASWQGLEVVPELGAPDVAVTGPGELFPFSKNSFDVALCLDVLEHMPDEPAARRLLRQLRWCVRPNGRMLVTVAWFSDVRPVSGALLELHTLRRGDLWWCDTLRLCGWRVDAAVVGRTVPKGAVYWCVAR